MCVCVCVYNNSHAVVVVAWPVLAACRFICLRTHLWLTLYPRCIYI